MPLNFFKPDNKMLNFKAIITTLIATVITVGAGIWITGLVGPVPISVTQTLTEKEHAFQASGDAELEVEPDEVQVSLGIQLERSTVTAAQSAANEIINRVTDKLADLGLNKDKIKTQNYDLQPQYDYSGQKRKVTGYSVSTNLLVTMTDFSLLNQALNAATGLGANQISGISFSLSEEKQEELRKEARKIAIAEAQDNAKELAKLAGIKLGKVVNVSESKTSRTPQPLFAQAEMAPLDQGSEEPTQIQPGSKTYTYSVTLSYETL